ncbi:MAG: D-alanine-D-alanine ligase [Tenuifilum sp.]|jgi:D-alanine-D-alanine ligase|uniref:D-alanine--D-alanine ligase n=1 Tax=Tenuifilum sp. TaxID=2760880 RepID=UPI0024AC0C1F|nr:D-alanine--D-alanine ligase [Tenuifilum sp.]MDI3526697.1 D-alanine-D-alanine ligase [Tenuifilum sp.]
MSSKLNIAIMAGGDSSEANISLQSATQIAGWLDPERFNAFKIIVKESSWSLEQPGENPLPIDKNDFTVTINGKRIAFDCALIAIHGTPGENGLLQAYFQMLKIPYTTGGVMNSAVTFNKYFSKELVAATGVSLAKDVIIKRGENYVPEEIVEKLGLPVFVKPNESGSSYGVTKVKTIDDLAPAIDKAFTEDEFVIVEEFISGRELTCGVFKGAKNEIVLPVTEIIPETEFFDYDAKYLNKSQEITPAQIPDQLKERIQNFSSKIYDRLQCKGIVRVDYIVRDENIYFLEINTVPGMSAASIVPQQVRATGMNMRDFFTMVVEDAIERSGR